MRGQPQWRGGKAGDAIKRQRQHAAQRIVAFPGETRIALIADTGLAEPHPAHHAAHEAIAFGHGVQLIDHPARHQPEIAGVGGNGNVDQPVEQAIEAGGTGALKQAFTAPLDALAIDHVMALRQREQHLREQFRRVLQIGINHQHQLAPADGKPGGKRQLVPMVARQINPDDGARARAMLADQAPGAVARTIIDQHDLVIAGKLRFANRRQPGNQRVDDLLLVIARHDHRKADAGIAGA